MRRSKYGYLLLALLVITGLAGTVTSTSITSKERKFAVNILKDTKSEVLETLKNLSKAQAEFKATPDQCSAKECIYQVAFAEKDLWDLLQTTLNQPANPEKRSKIKWTDEQLMNVVKDLNNKVKTSTRFVSENVPFKTVDEALEVFKTERTNHIKYIKSTTEDLRNHVLKMSFGWLDCYQLCLMISVVSSRQIQLVKELRADPNFPSR
jgi:hypothetical protein